MACKEQLSTTMSELCAVCYIQGRFNENPEFFVYRAFIANSEIIIFLLFNIVPF
jgi:hypothetical protein